MGLASKLRDAAGDGDEEAVRQLLAAGAPVDQPHASDYYMTYWSPLKHAIHWQHAGVVRLLLEAAPATAAKKTFWGRTATALHYAAVADALRGKPAQLAIVRLLLEAAPAAAVAVDGNGMTPLHQAAGCAGSDVVRMLLSAAPAAATMLDDHQSTPIHLAAFFSNKAAVQPLLDADLSLACAPDEDGRTPLHLVLRETGDNPGYNRTTVMDVVRTLLSAAPAAATLLDRYQNAPIHLAAYRGIEPAVQLLLEAAPANAVAVNIDGRTPLHLGAASGCAGRDAVRMLLSTAPAAATALDRFKQAPIHIAAYRRNEAAVQLLLDAAPSLAFAPDGDGCTPLHLVLLKGTYRDLPGTSPYRCGPHRYSFWDTARCLLRAAPAVQPSLGILLQSGGESAYLYADLAACLPLSREQWHSIPAPCPDLARALPAVLERSAAEAGWLVGLLAEEQRARLRAAALSLAWAQQQSRTVLPAELSGRILALYMHVWDPWDP